MPPIKPKPVEDLLEQDPLWYKDAIIYQLHIRSFQDSNADGIGDLAGLTERLDYLQDLGVTALWLLPFYPSPLRDDGYDIADYTGIHSQYGNLQDFRVFLREAHRRGLRVISELVLNHTSDQHPWFQRARRAPAGSSARNFYVWSDTAEKYPDARIIFRDFETSNWAWDPVARAYYWHRFYSHQPDLNFDNREVRRAVLQALNFWLDLGVDGLRLDAVPYLYEREGTSCENLPETHSFLKLVRRHVDDRYRARMLLAEANQWPEDAVQYFGAGDECHMAFHFPLMPRLFMGIRMEDRFPVVDILQQTPAIPETAQWATFLRNHDELTLEMVTDEDRDYMYRVYAQDPRARINLGIRRRLAPLLGNDRRRIELMKGLLFSLPGTPVLYYGDEIGMGDNIYLGDRNGVRTPMQWTGDRNAGFSRANPQRLFLPVITDPEYHFETVNVEAQQQNPHSLLWWLKRLIALRKRHHAFGRGSFELIAPENRKILAYVRRCDGEVLLVVGNLSRFAQPFQLDLHEFAGRRPVEVFGRTPFPPITGGPYPLTLGPHSFYWFALEPVGSAVATASAIPSEAGAEQAAVAQEASQGPREAAPNSAPETAAAAALAEPGGTARAAPPRTDSAGPAIPIPVLFSSEEWRDLIADRGRRVIEEALPAYLQRSRWFGGKAKQIVTTRIVEAVPLGDAPDSAHWVFVRVEYAEGEPEVYGVPLAAASGTARERIHSFAPWSILGTLRGGRSAGDADVLLYDPTPDPAFGKWLLEFLVRRRSARGSAGTISASLSSGLRKPGALPPALPPATIMGREQSNTSLAYDERFVLKLFRRVEEGVNPDLEVGRFLTEQTNFRHVPAVEGAVEYRTREREPQTLGILQQFIPNEGDAWRLTVDELTGAFDRILTGPDARGAAAPPRISVLLRSDVPVPDLLGDVAGSYPAHCELLARRVAELHIALASNADVPAFAPEKFPVNHQRALYQSLRSMARNAIELLRGRLDELPPEVHSDATRLLAREGELFERAQEVLSLKLTGARIRIHGDLHLGQILYTGRDFYLIDFEGEPRRSLGERRFKHSCLRDVAGMLRSFEYAAWTVLHAGAGIRPADVPRLEPWAWAWRDRMSALFLDGYLKTVADAPFLPAKRTEIEILLRHFLLEKAAYEVMYEMNHRPEWVRIPVIGLLQILDERD